MSPNQLSRKKRSENKYLGLEDAFSAVSKLILQRKSSFCSICEIITIFTHRSKRRKERERESSRATIVTLFANVMACGSAGTEVCYRRFGHNEGDNPEFTQPVMYKKVAKHPEVDQIMGDSPFSYSSFLTSAVSRSTF